MVLLVEFEENSRMFGLLGVIVVVVVLIRLLDMFFLCVRKVFYFLIEFMVLLLLISVRWWRNGKCREMSLVGLVEVIVGLSLVSIVVKFFLRILCLSSSIE